MSERLAPVLRAALARVATDVTAMPCGEWRFRLPGARRCARARLAPGWLSFDATLRAARRSRGHAPIEAALRCNARLDGVARIVGDDSGRQVTVDLPADVLPWDREADLQAIVSAALADLRAPLGGGLRGADTGGPTTAPSRQGLAALFEAAGWPAQAAEEQPPAEGRQATAGQSLDIPLEVPGHYLTGRAFGAARAVGLRVPLPAGGGAAASARCRSAVHGLLWEAAGRSRMIKPTLSKHGVALEAALPCALADAAGLAHVCSALSAVLQLVASETRLLGEDERLAALYLSVIEPSEAARGVGTSRTAPMPADVTEH